MIGKTPNEHQMSIFEVALKSFIEMNHELVLLSRQIDQEAVESELAETEVQCISKGKEHKKYEFGNKSAIAKMRSGLIVSARTIMGDSYDGPTISARLQQTKHLTGYSLEEAVTNRRYRGKKEIGRTKISIPTSGTSCQSCYQKTKARKRFQKRAGIEPDIDYLKSNYVALPQGHIGDVINTPMEAAAYKRGIE